MKLKVCGMRDLANIEQVASLRPDYMGFIFYNQTPRYVGDQFELPSTFPENVKKVGVFVKMPVDAVIAITSKYGMSHVQLHGGESVEECKALREHGLKVIKVFSVDEAFDFKVVELYEDAADYYLFDTKGKLYGGNAKVFDWSILERYDQRKPFFLSGGLSPENVDQVARLASMNIHALDVNSGVELLPGIKDLKKVNDVVGRIRYNHKV